MRAILLMLTAEKLVLQRATFKEEASRKKWGCRYPPNNIVSFEGRNI